MNQPVPSAARHGAPAIRTHARQQARIIAGGRQ